MAFGSSIIVDASSSRAVVFTFFLPGHSIESARVFGGPLDWASVSESGVRNTDSK